MGGVVKNIKNGQYIGMLNKTKKITPVMRDIQKLVQI
jgi:hypothetical protein